MEAHLTSSPVFMTLLEDDQIRTSFQRLLLELLSPPLVLLLSKNKRPSPEKPTSPTSLSFSWPFSYLPPQAISYSTVHRSASSGASTTAMATVTYSSTRFMRLTSQKPGPPFKCLSPSASQVAGKDLKINEMRIYIYIYENQAQKRGLQKCFLLFVPIGEYLISKSTNIHFSTK